MNSNIIKLRKKIFDNLKRQAFEYEENHPELLTYLKDQVDSSQGKFEQKDFDYLSQKVLSSDVTYLGDFHTFDQNIRNVLRIIKIILTQNSEVVLGLEMVSHHHQIYLDAYTDGHLTDLEFLDCIQYHNSWRFPWTHYKLIFEIVKKYQIKVIALNTEGSLSKRDRFAADLIAKEIESKSDAKFLVFYGELHITKNKIPKLLKEKIPLINQTIIHQNLDEVYWRMTELGKEYGLVSFNENEFCIISAPPWIKYESMIYWYENLSDDPDFDIHEYIIQNGAKTFTGNTEEDFLQISHELALHLELKQCLDTLDDFNLYDHLNLEYVEEKLKKKISKSLYDNYKKLISLNKSFIFPNETKYYCSSYSMNRISYLAGVHIYANYLKINEVNRLDILQSKSTQQKVILYTFQAMYAFFFSKIINPHRKCMMYKDLENLKEDRLAQKAIQVLNQDNFSKIATKIGHVESYLLGEYLGHILGEYLYDYSLTYNHKINLEKDFLMLSPVKVSLERVMSVLLSGKDYKNHAKRYF